MRMSHVEGPDPGVEVEVFRRAGSFGYRDENWVEHEEQVEALWRGFSSMRSII
jgi:hypothetical protein